MGYKSSIEMVLTCNIIVCLLFMVQAYIMIRCSHYSLKVAQALKGDESGEIQDSMERLMKTNLRPQDSAKLQRIIKSFLFISVIIIVLMAFASAVRYKITEKSIDRETRIVNQFLFNKGNQKERGADALSWNYIHAIKLLRDQHSTESDSIVKIFTDEQEEFLDNDNRHPAIWTLIYIFIALYFLKWSSRSIYEFGKRQEMVNRMFKQWTNSQQQ